MAAEYRGPGEIIDYTATASVAYHDVVTIGTLIGVARHSAEAGDTIAVDICGVYKMPKTADEAITAGTKVYWTSGAITATAGDVAAGVAVADAAAADTTVDVKINI